jgi:hypothetical protein
MAKRKGTKIQNNNDHTAYSKHDWNNMQ